jgi:hypothetical protein
MSDIRRVQKQSSSLTVSLPHQWSKSQNILKGSYVSISQSKGRGDKLIIRKLQQEAIE